VTPADQSPSTDRTMRVEQLGETAEVPAAQTTPVQGQRSARGRRAALVGTVLVIAAVAGTGLGVAVALPGLLPGPPAAPGPAQPSYVIDTRPTPSPTRQAAAPQPSPVAAEYTVEAGDTLRSVAAKLYGDAELWPSLYEANRDTIGPNPDALRVGMRLRAPPL